jgi:hypothetical protein
MEAGVFSATKVGIITEVRPALVARPEPILQTVQLLALFARPGPTLGVIITCAHSALMVKSPLRQVQHRARIARPALLPQME